MQKKVPWPNIPYDEYRKRIDRAKECLAEDKIDAMILFSPYNWYYYGGFTDAAQMHNKIWQTALIVSQDHDPVILADTGLSYPLGFTSWVENIKFHTKASHPRCLDLRSSDDFHILLFDTLKELGLINKTIGLETGADISTYLSIDEYQKIKDMLSAAKIVSADPTIWAQRMIKTPFEQELIREGCRRACLCVRAAFETIRPGVNERDLHKAFWHKAVELDLVESPYHATWLCFSGNSSEFWGGRRWIMGPVDRVLKKGDWGHSDCGPTYKMYQFDFQRAFSVGEPHEKTSYYYNIGKEAYFETVEAIKPGIRPCDLFNLAVEALRKRGYPDGPSITFIGHGEGLSNHEPPWITAEEKIELVPGMVLALEIGAFDTQYKYFGGMLEDIFLITDKGTENLTAYLSPDMYIAPTF